MPEKGELVQFGILTAFLFLAKYLFDFVKDLVVSMMQKRHKSESGNGHDNDSEDFQSKILIQSADFRRLIEAIETNTEAVKKLLHHEDDERRILYRIEKQLDSLEQH